MNDVANTVFNIADFEAADTAILEVQNKQDSGPLLFAGQPVRIHVRSPGTREAMQAQHKIEQANTAKTFAGMRGKQVKDSIEDKIKARAEKLTAITAQIENFPIAPLELYTNPKLGYISDQVERFHASWENF